MIKEACKIEQQSQCTAYAEILSGSLNITDELIGELENKLSSVLMPAAPIDPDEKCADEDSLVPLAFELRHQNGRIISNNNNIKSILARLEN